ncbi:MAG: hypothetical protein AN485_21335 [Anabaena sp. MDT14b]|nr:MAG: hypothetical protein AN485_21335 [Anabaena sp. MDT14b]
MGADSALATAKELDAIRKRASTGGRDPDKIPSDSAVPMALAAPGEGVDITPVELREEALRTAHAAGHRGSRGTMHRLLSEGYRWPKMEQDCLRVSRECIDCQRYTTQKYGFHPLRTISASLPMDHLAMDLIVMETSEDGMNYILIVVDICTRFLWLFALANKSGTEIATHLRKLFLMFGPPRIIQSDNGSEFVNIQVVQMLSATGVDHRRISTYHPEANGAAERHVRTVKECLRTFMKGDTGHWPRHVDEVQYTLNTSVHRRHGSTPFSLFFARMHAPIKGEPLARPLRPLSEKELLARFSLMNKVVFPSLQVKTGQYTDRMFHDFMKRHKIITDDFPQGSLVMRQVKPRANKYVPKWEGPYMVVRRTRGGSYILRDTTNDIVTQGVPVSQLRLVSYENNLSPDSFEVDHVVDHRGTTGAREYLIRWKGFDASYDQWVAASDVNTLECVTDYWSRRRQSPRDNHQRDSRSRRTASAAALPLPGAGFRATESTVPMGRPSSSNVTDIANRPPAVRKRGRADLTSVSADRSRLRPRRE